MSYVFIALVLFAVLLVIIANRPDSFRLARSATIAAPPLRVFEQVNDFHNWDAWSPWAKIDPNCKVTFDGTASGVGAGFSWEGNNKVGAGRQRILESQPGERIRIQLEFLRPFRAQNEVEFTFQPEIGGTRVTWAMSGKNNFMAKAFSLVMDCEKMVGPDFEKGLASLKAVAEAAAKG